MPLAEVADILDNKRVPINSKEREGRQGGIPYYGATGQVGWIDEHIFDEELVLLGEDGAPFLDPGKPKAYVVRGKSWVNNHAHVLRARDVPTAWLHNYLNTINYRDFVTGTTRLKLTQAEMRKIMVPVAPKATMLNVVAEIERQFSRLDEAVASLQRVKANLKRYKAAVQKSAVTGRLVPTEADLARCEGRNYETGAQLLHRIVETRRSQWQGKGKYKEPAAPDTTDLPELPEGWVWATTEQVCLQVASGSTPQSTAMFPDQGDVPFLKVYNLTFDGSLDFTVKPTFVARSTHEGMLARSRSIPGDVLTNIVGPPLGKISVVPPDHPEWNINQAIVTFRVSEAIMNWLLAYWLMAPPIQRRLERTAKATAGQFNLQVSTCRCLAIPLPPLPEQHRIVAEVDRLLSIAREAEAEVETNLKRAEGLRQAILAKAFRPNAVPPAPTFLIQGNCNADARSTP